jgi:hypothetical protein
MVHEADRGDDRHLAAGNIGFVNHPAHAAEVIAV